MRPRTHRRPSSFSLWLITLVPLVVLTYWVFRAGGVVGASTEFSDAPLVGPGAVLRSVARGDVSDLHCVDMVGVSFAFRVEPLEEPAADREAPTDRSSGSIGFAGSARTSAPRSCAAFSILGPGGQSLYQERTERCGNTGRYTLDNDRVTVIAGPQRGYELQVIAIENPGRYCVSVRALPSDSSQSKPAWPYRLTVAPH